MTYLFNTPDQQREMLRTIGAESVDELFDQVPADCRLSEPLQLPRLLPRWISSAKFGRSLGKTWREVGASV